MERINGEIRDREKTMRGLKTRDTPILQGMHIFHNYIRPHQGLEGKTPAEVCGIQIKGDNKWVTLIQNASIGGGKRDSIDKNSTDAINFEQKLYLSKVIDSSLYGEK